MLGETDNLSSPDDESDALAVLERQFWSDESDYRPEREIIPVGIGVRGLGAFMRRAWLPAGRITVRHAMPDVARW